MCIDMFALVRELSARAAVAGTVGHNSGTQGRDDMKACVQACVLATGVWFAGIAAGQGAASTPLGAAPANDAFKTEAEPWRSYFIAARKAEQLADPLARCLAYPDLPGTQWPAGYAAAHCHYETGRVPTIAEVEALLSAGEVGRLEQRLRELMAAHEAGLPERESIHRFFQQLSEVPDDGLRVTQQWITAAPHSALAAIARGSALKGAGWDARGVKWARETASGQMRMMSGYFNEAEEEFRRAISLEPRWVYPYIGLVDIGKADRPDVGEWGFAEARAIDPACGELAYRRMQSLEPRWGGSFAAMEAYAHELAAHVGRSPLIANQMSAPYVDAVDMLEDEQESSPEALALLERAVRISGLELGLHTTASALLNPTTGTPDRTRAVAMLLQESRFKAAGTWADRNIGRYFVATDPAWALHLLRRAVAADPANAHGRYYLAAANANAGNFAEADLHYRAAATDSGFEESALAELATMWLLDARLEPRAGAAKARPLVERLLAAHPRHPDGLYLRAVIDIVDGTGLPTAQPIRDFLAVADPANPEHARRRAALIPLLRHIESGSREPISVSFD